MADAMTTEATEDRIDMSLDDLIAMGRKEKKATQSKPAAPKKKDAAGKKGAGPKGKSPKVSATKTAAAASAKAKRAAALASKRGVKAVPIKAAIKKEKAAIVSKAAKKAKVAKQAARGGKGGGKAKSGGNAKGVGKAKGGGKSGGVGKKGIALKAPTIKIQATLRPPAKGKGAKGGAATKPKLNVTKQGKGTNKTKSQPAVGTRRVVISKA
eukprot:CAMPEP_0119538204 /NCGR_PEP_ID=MMETSP1344-20130328/50697_1 /TAXON_ID=236787 /ORGANISM="Florenciella parvula, Strain CCMP2471" /LENGTH=210 /DNA_ID=CAMNT_0007581015 /DNA_START=60 /DNA_END=688 /DNA_ORIENTATION=-